MDHNELNDKLVRLDLEEGLTTDTEISITTFQPTKDVEKLLGITPNGVAIRVTASAMGRSDPKITEEAAIVFVKFRGLPSWFIFLIGGGHFENQNRIFLRSVPSQKIKSKKGVPICTSAEKLSDTHHRLILKEVANHLHDQLHFIRLWNRDCEMT